MEPSHLDAFSPDAAARALGSDPSRGLDPAEACARLAREGPNDLPAPERESRVSRLLRQFREPMALLLMAAALVSGLGLRQPIDAAAILTIVILNAAIAAIQEGTAGRALDALRALESPQARVRRGGVTALVPTRELVPGDIVFLAAGDRVPADIRLIETSALEIDESLLTGESLPVPKDAGVVVTETAAISERPSMGFAGTLVTRGSAIGVVAATGARTELGAIAERLREPRVPTPLEFELSRLTTRLGLISILVASTVFALILARMGTDAQSVQRAFLAAVALAVAAVPEGLATVTVVALALGVRRMAARGAIVRRLPAVETLGSTTVLAIDKTGTLTENRLHLDEIALPGLRPLPPAELDPEAVARVAEVAILCNDATLDPPAGDPLEVALLEALGKGRATEVRARAPRMAAAPFDSARKRMSTLHRAPGGLLLLVKGAPEAVVARCASVLLVEYGASLPLEERKKAAILAAANEMTAGGMRVLALARRSISEPPKRIEEAERDLTLVALAGLRDPIRPEAARAVAEVRAAGIRLLMVSGDHPGTAASVARDVGMIEKGSAILTGDDLRERGIPGDPTVPLVYARVDPEQKLLLVRALQRLGHVVAMTGDGVNDAPALRRADIGVAMGRRGSDVAREAADMVVTDDNLATIVTAVREGRGIYDNIRKVVDYLVAGNLSEILVVVLSLAIFPALGVPLLPLQLLWINLLTDGAPALALGVDPVHPALMERPPRRAEDRLLSGGRAVVLAARGLLMAAVALGSLAITRISWGEPWAHARAVMFTVLVVSHLLYALAARLPVRASRHASAPNRWLWIAIAAGLGLQLLVIGWTPAHALLGTAPLSPREWGLVAVGGVLPVLLLHCGFLFSGCTPRCHSGASCGGC